MGLQSVATVAAGKKPRLAITSKYKASSGVRVR
jgi:hypothetical protein